MASCRVVLYSAARQLGVGRITRVVYMHTTTITDARVISEDTVLDGRRAVDDAKAACVRFLDDAVFQADRQYGILHEDSVPTITRILLGEQDRLLCRTFSDDGREKRYSEIAIDQDLDPWVDGDAS